MLNYKGHDFKIDYFKPGLCRVFIDGNELKQVTAINVRETGPDVMAEVTVTFMPGNVSITRSYKDAQPTP